jgi:hypothetical protein
VASTDAPLLFPAASPYLNSFKALAISDPCIFRLHSLPNYRNDDFGQRKSDYLECITAPYSAEEG